MKRDRLGMGRVTSSQRSRGFEIDPVRYSGAPEAIIDNVIAGIFQIPLQLSRECSGRKEHPAKIPGPKTGLADACLIQLAEEFGTWRNPDVGSELCDLSLGKEYGLPFVA
jgi:hypothetical protein